MKMKLRITSKWVNATKNTNRLSRWPTKPRRQIKKKPISIGGSVTLSHWLQPIHTANSTPSNGPCLTPRIQVSKSGPTTEKLVRQSCLMMGTFSFCFPWALQQFGGHHHHSHFASHEHSYLFNWLISTKYIYSVFFFFFPFLFITYGVTCIYY